jgi:putative tributyrin esterase
VKATPNLRVAAALFCLILLLTLGCKKKDAPAPPDRPRLTANVVMQDVTFRSAALNRDMQYRVVFPKTISPGKRLPVVYLLHGGGSSFRAWSNDSDVARFAESGLILVMPEGNSSYYTNSASQPQDRYEDYIVSDLISDVEHRFPVAATRASRAVIGVSMGGFGAINLALKHPDLFAFAGALSPAVDVPSRPFSAKRIEQWQRFGSIFGPWGSKTRHDNDPFILAALADQAKTPYLFLTCGEQEGLLPTNRKFAALLAQLHFRYEFHTAPGDHNFNQWNAGLPALFQSLFQHISQQPT